MYWSTIVHHANENNPALIRKYHMVKLCHTLVALVYLILACMEMINDKRLVYKSYQALANVSHQGMANWLPAVIRYC